MLTMNIMFVIVEHNVVKVTQMNYASVCNNTLFLLSLSGVLFSVSVTTAELTDLTEKRVMQKNGGGAV